MMMVMMIVMVVMMIMMMVKIVIHDDGELSELKCPDLNHRYPSLLGLLILRKISCT